MKKRILSILLSVIMLLGMLPVTALPALAETGEVEYLKLYNSSSGQTIGDADVPTYYYVDSDITCMAEDAGVSGLSIRDWAEVHIVVEKGATLTCIGAAGSGISIGGGAGIEVPEHATLYLEGEGSVIAKGGAGANGADGDQGQGGYFKGHFDIIMLGTAYDYYGGNGGRGGNGGAGAGAGIGTVGGVGGVGGIGGQGDGGTCEKDHMRVTTGEKGYHGAKAKPAGTVRTSRTVKLTAVGGAYGKGGNSTISSGLKYLDYYQYNCTAVPGCSGGGGQGGGAGASVGNGGQGGGGGTGGNGSPAIFRYGNDFFDVKLYTGYGGGNTDGNYIEESNMGQGGEKFILSKNNYVFNEKDDYPYLELKFGAAGGTDGVEHVHTFDENGCCIVCTKPVWLIEDGVLLEYNGFGGTIVIPEEVTKIADNVFSGNKTVTDIVFPSALEEIGSSAFQETILKNIDIPASVKAIGDNAFRDCISLKNVTVNWTDEDKIATLQDDAFTGIASDCVLSVPTGTAQLYKNNAVWSKFSLISDTVLYMAYDPESKTFVQKVTPAAPTALTSTDESLTLSDEWYAVDGEVTVGERITVSGNVNLVLKDGCKLTLDQGLEIFANSNLHSSLTIYAQAKGTGELVMPGVSENFAGIGISDFATLNIHGGIIEAYGGKYAAGIGGGYQYRGGTVTVYGGSVTARGYSGGSGIGNGSYSNGCSSFTIYGGKVYAYGSGDNAAGISGNVTVNGGEVNTNNTIGGTDSKVVINDGKVTIESDRGVIGGNNSTVEINGGDIKVGNNITIGVEHFYGHDAEITIRGGNIDASCFYYPAIGGNTNRVYVNIYGGNIKAQSTGQDAIVATSVTVYPDAEECERFTLKDFSGNVLSGSPVTAEKDITSLLSENREIQIDLVYEHTFTGDYVNHGDGTHSRKCSVCGVLNDASNHTFANHNCVCGATNDHDFKGEYKDNGDGTHSRKCTQCDEYGATSNHTFDNHTCVCGAKTAEAIAAALLELDNAAKNTVADKSKAIANEAKPLIENAQSADEANAVLSEALTKIASEEKTLADAKTAAKAAIDKAAGTNQSAEMQKIVSEVKAAIDNAKSLEEVEKAKQEGLKAIEAQKQAEKPTEPEKPSGKCPKCGGTHADNFFGKIACFFNRVINWFKNLFK